MAGKKDIVEQALKLIAGGAKEAGPSAAERAAQNLDVLNTAKRLGENTSDIRKLQETKSLMEFSKKFREDVKSRSQSLMEAQKQLQSQGAFPFDVGTRFTTAHARENNLGPHTVTGYYVNPQDPHNSYGYRVRQDLGNGDYQETNVMIRDPRLEALHGAEKWEQLQRGFVPITGLKVVKANGGSVREGYAGKGRVVGDIVDQALKLVAGEGEEAAKTGIRAYHGSPHDFPPVRHIEMPDGTQLYQNMLENPNTPEGAKILQEYPLGRFDMSKIGTGEGAQAYGHGLYFAGNEDVARGYRERLAPPATASIGGQPIDRNLLRDVALDIGIEFPGQAVNTIQGRIKSADDIANYAEQLSNIDINQLRQTFPKVAQDVEVEKAIFDELVKRGLNIQRPNKGHMYEVNIAADPNTFLDWDKPLSEQPEFLDRLAKSKSKYARELLALPDLKSPTRNVYGTDIGPMTGQDAFKNLAIATTGRVTGGPKTTELLNKAGIPGIKYLDAGSRGAGDGTRNYVVFDDKLISIIRKYGIAGASAMLGYNLMENLNANQAQAATVADKEYQATQPEVRGGMLPPGMEPSGEMTSRIPSASERIYDYVRSVLGGDEATKGQRAETVMNIIDQTPLAAGPMAYDIGRGIAEKVAYADGGAVDDDITDAIRIAKDVGGGTTPVMLEDAKGNKYDAQGNLIPPTAPGPAPARTPTPQEVGQRAANDPATFDALMQQYAVPDRDIAQYEATKEAVAAQPYETQQMTHVGEKPRREVTVDMPLFGGEYSLGTAPYDAASGMGTLAQTAYDWKTAPFYAIPLTAPLAAGMDVAEGVATEDPLTASLAIGFGPGGKYAKAAGIGAVNYFMDPSEAEAGPARWFSKAVEAARNIPMNKMTGEQALAMLRKSVSPEELNWTNADRFLPGQETITKQDLIDYLEKDRVKTEDVVLGGNKPTRREDVRPTETAVASVKPRWDELVQQRRALTEEYYALPYEEQKKRQVEFTERLYGIDEEKDKLRAKMVDATIEEMGGLGQPVRYGPGSTYGEKYMTRGGEDYRETLITLPRKEFGNLYQSGHWEGIPNVVGHIRTQVLDVTPPGSNRPYKAFNVDEAQSDYAKAGRKKGFVTLEDKASLPSLVKQYDELNKQRREAERIVASGDDTTPEVRDAAIRMANLNRQMMDLSDKMTAIRSGGVPVAPYVTSTQNWTDLSIKKALDQALDAGADYFTYTPGEVQANRYGLSEDLQSIAYDPVSNTLEYMPKTGGWNAVPQKVPPEKLPEYIGKEMAEKLMAQEGQYVGGAYKKKVLENDDLKLGGHGMRDYYDNIYKKRVEKVVKDATGKKVQWEVIPVQTADGPREQLGFRLTDDFQNARFSDFNKGGRVTGSTKYADSDTVSRALALTSEV